MVIPAIGARRTGTAASGRPAVAGIEDVRKAKVLEWLGRSGRALVATDVVVNKIYFAGGGVRLRASSIARREPADPKT